MYAEVPANGSALLDAGEPPQPVSVDGRVLDNGLVRVELAEDGTHRDLTADREVLADKGNLLRLHSDLPNYWDAWDIDKHYKNRYTDLLDAESVTVVEDGPLLGALKVERAFGKGSRIVQTITVRAGSRRIDVETEIDWHEAEKILKAAFPVDHPGPAFLSGDPVRPCPAAHAHQHQLGVGPLEVYGHRWVHMAEPGYGVAVINDSTYGHDVSRTVREDGWARPRPYACPSCAPRACRTRGRPGQAPLHLRAAAGREHRGRDRGGVRAQPAAAGGFRPVRPSRRLRGRRGRDHRGGQARRRRLGRCRRTPLVPRRSRLRHPAHRFPLAGGQEPTSWSAR